MPSLDALQSRARRLLQLAHLCISGALQFDYLSNGARHRYAAPMGNTNGAGRAATAANARTIKAPPVGPGMRRRQRYDLVSHYLCDIATRRRLTSSEEYRLASAIRHGDLQARQRLVEAQLHLVVAIARRYRNRGLPMQDLIAEGNLGLLTAVSKFDPERGYRLSTYAKWWVRQAIELALLTQIGIVHVPVYVRRELRRRARTHGSAATAELAVLENSARLLLHDVRNQAEPFRDSDESPFNSVIDTVVAPEDDQPEWSLYLENRRAYLEKLLLRLSPTERLIIRARFGLDADEIRTLNSLAQELNLSCERVRQIQTIALRKLHDTLRQEDNADTELLPA